MRSDLTVVVLAGGVTTTRRRFTGFGVNGWIEFGVVSVEISVVLFLLAAFSRALDRLEMIPLLLVLTVTSTLFIVTICWLYTLDKGLRLVENPNERYAEVKVENRDGFSNR